MKIVRTSIPLIALAALAACGGAGEDTPAPAAPPDRPPEISALLEAVDGSTAMSWGQFRNLAQWHEKMRRWPPADARLLLAIREGDEKLADALLTYGDQSGEAATERAFVQYLTSKPEDSVPGDIPHPMAKQWAEKYAQRLSVVYSPNFEPSDDLASLRESLVLINRVRYGWDQVISALPLAFVEGAAYTKPNAMWMAEMAALAYHPEMVVREQLTSWGYDVDASFRWFDDKPTGTQAFLVANGSRVIVSFRGTETGFRDFKTDLQLTSTEVPWAEGRVHRGFAKAVDGVWSAVAAAVSGERGNRTLFVTGHSLGAALAQLAAVRLQSSGQDVTAVYAFGSPMVGDDDFARAYERLLPSRTFPHINHKDAVTTVPPRWLGYAPLAAAATRLFTGPGHDMTILEGADAGVYDARTPAGLEVPPIERPMDTEELEPWFAEAEHDLFIANQFLAQPPQSLEPGSYGQVFLGGRIDDHGINQYLFKLGCTILDERWAEETARARAGAASAN